MLCVCTYASVRVLVEFVHWLSDRINICIVHFGLGVCDYE